MSPNHLICVVDDDPSMLRMLTRSMSAAGFEVAPFSSAEALLISGQISRAACLILDVDLPGLSGLELQQRLNLTGRNVPIIFISGQATEKKRHRALLDGAVAFLDKPFNISALLDAVRSISVLTLA
ncbi:MAG TPA: response regulator [Pyrinomonadaceae bacterium]|nr:response regulator [Pyrinomonadaceae bacterium]